jgi:hypothetical protein
MSCEQVEEGEEIAAQLRGGKYISDYAVIMQPNLGLTRCQRRR